VGCALKTWLITPIMEYFALPAERTFVITAVLRIIAGFVTHSILLLMALAIFVTSLAAVNARLIMFVQPALLTSLSAIICALIVRYQTVYNATSAIFARDAQLILI